MESRKVFKIALLISIALHGVILIQSAQWEFLETPRKNKPEKIQVHYVKSPRKIDFPRLKSEGRSKPEPFLQLPAKISAKEVPLPPEAKRDELFTPKKGDSAVEKNIYTKPSFNRPDIVAIKTKITLSSDKDLEKNNSPTYVAHSQVVREKIKRALYQNNNRLEMGQVLVSFVLGQDGSLRNSHIIERNSSDNPYLRQIALQSIKDASPFPAFPKELDYDELTFNVVISFEVE